MVWERPLCSCHEAAHPGSCLGELLSVPCSSPPIPAEVIRFVRVLGLCHNASEYPGGELCHWRMSYIVHLRSLDVGVG